MAAPPDPRLAGINWEDSQQIKPPHVQAIPLPTMQPGDHYRPSAVLDTYIRIRDCYCTWPGCDKRAWTADLDHSDEYNHADPQAGGRTHPSGMKALCRFHHLLKTHTDWLDDQYVDAHGRTRTTITTPEGRTYDGPAWTGEDLFPALQRIIWDESSPTTRRNTPDNPLRARSRLAAKHARRRQERMRNRLRREAIEEADGPPLF